MLILASILFFYLLNHLYKYTVNFLYSLDTKARSHSIAGARGVAVAIACGMDIAEVGAAVVTRGTKPPATRTA